MARELVGCTLSASDCAGLVVETEAYAGDAASHYVTRRPSAGHLLGSTHGLAYVYVIYGMHLCLNVTADDRRPGAVLLRALQPLSGLEAMRERRGSVSDLDLCRGPGRLAQALGVTRALNGQPFLEHFSIERPIDTPDIVAGPRIGISHDVHLPWRFCLAASRFVSSPRPRE